ncbi:MAG TPA: alanine--tRNA ligase [Alphaproteobacteria bacterium]|nr:alanine--tRNA ligase [Alphaproteobacteria bacterium]
MTGNEIRQRFLQFFADRGHAIVPSSSLVPRDDPTLLFTNAGMVQFKDVFLGRERRSYVRAVTAQKCMRAGGKHNDLENVGRTARHHTFFEMLGNFSFGDYFKTEAIAYAWEFVTQDLNLPSSRLYVSIYQDDEEAFEIWHHHVGVPADRIFRFGEKDNFWAMGDTGPCGPCSEIFYDHGPAASCGRAECTVGCDCDRYVEIWNLVFMQFERDASGRLTPLPKPSIDTGMGLERITAVLQGVLSNYDTDLLRPIIRAVEEHSGKSYGANPADDVSMRVIADHARAISFLLSDGVLPSNEGRGYVLRRIIRRAARHGRMLGFTEPFLYKVLGTVADEMGGAYAELNASRQFAANVTLHEEERFSYTLESGMRVLARVADETRQRGGAEIPGEEVFKLYDTYGFPLDLAEEIVRDQGLTLDLAGFDRAMDRQRELARASWKGRGEEAVQPIYPMIAERFGATRFLGYDDLEGQGKVLAILKGDRLVDAADEGQEIEVVIDQTPFYAEGGGQVGDTGLLVNPNVILEVLDTTRPADDLIVHRALVKRGRVRVQEVLHARVESQRRQAIALNHTGTHILHATLKQVLGDHVKQAGSLVAPDRLRFDFTHFGRLADRELYRIEDIVNERIREDRPVEVVHADLHEALRMGAIALFGEKYGDQVRVVKIGDFSLELCGGTHLNSTGEIGLFKITQASGVAAGVRRVEALTGAAAFQHVRRQEMILNEIRDLLKAQAFEEPARVQRLLDQVRELEREIETLKGRLASARTHDLMEGVTHVRGVNVLTLHEEAAQQKDLRSIVDLAKERLQSGVVVAATVVDGKVALVAGVTPDLTGRVHAGELAKAVAALVDGSGGGRADMAQAGGKRPEKLSEALAKVPELVETQLQKN